MRFPPKVSFRERNNLGEMHRITSMVRVHFYGYCKHNSDSLARLVLLFIHKENCV